MPDIRLVEALAAATTAIYPQLGQMMPMAVAIIAQDDIFMPLRIDVGAAIEENDRTIYISTQQNGQYRSTCNCINEPFCGPQGLLFCYHTLAAWLYDISYY